MLGEIGHKSVIDQTITAIHAEQLNLNAKPAVCKIIQDKATMSHHRDRHEYEKPHS